MPSKPSNGGRRSVTMKVVAKPPAGAAVFNIQGGPFVADAGTDTNYLCGNCGKVVASVPGTISFRSENGQPVVFVCYSCGAYNLAP
jgi:hypothetical protein